METTETFERDYGVVELAREWALGRPEVRLNPASPPLKIQPDSTCLLGAV